MQSLHSADPRGCSPLPPDGCGPPWPQGKLTHSKVLRNADSSFLSFFVLWPITKPFLPLNFFLTSQKLILHPYLLSLRGHAYLFQGHILRHYQLPMSTSLFPHSSYQSTAINSSYAELWITSILYSQSTNWPLLIKSQSQSSHVYWETARLRPIA